MRNTTDRYGLVARVLHWSIGLLLICQVLGGLYVFKVMERGAERTAMVGLHKAMGVTLFLLVLARIAWRLYDKPPAFPAGLGQRMADMAKAGHGALYAFMIGLPILGLLTSDTGGRPTDVFGLFTVPVMIGEDEALHELFEVAHVYGAWAFGLFIVGHIGVALWHKYGRKDGVADRML
jgi:cytochrome b561